MIDRDRIITDLKNKIAHAKGIDRDFVYLPVWQAKELLEYLKPQKARETKYGLFCPECGELISGGFCSGCGQAIKQIAE